MDLLELSKIFFPSIAIALESFFYLYQLQIVHQKGHLVLYEE